MSKIMSNRSKADRNREKVIQDRLQLLLTRMLQDEDNKYCIDCDSKGPRWASWNIGIFLCIRCAGIHRNLGVHISKVKSVNLDSWTPQQVASMQMMGNSRGRAVYEAGVPEDFRRPQNDSALESFIRAKYEKKKYIAREWTPSKPPDLPLGWDAIIEAEKQKKDLRSVVLPSRANTKNEPTSKTSPVISKTPVPAKIENSETTSPSISASATSSSVDLLGLSLQTNEGGDGAATVNSLVSNLDLLSMGGSGNVDGFSNFVSAPDKTRSQPPSNSSDFEATFTSTVSSEAIGSSSSSQMSKDSIMALFNKPISSGGAATVAPGVQPSQPMTGGSGNANTLAGLDFRAPGFAQQGGFNQFQQQPSFGAMNTQSQLNQFGGMQGLGGGAQPSQNPASNPFLSNTIDLAFGTMNGLAATNGNAKNSSWGFGQ